MEKKYKYDIAISFSEADRNVALCIYLALMLNKKSSGYYYPEKQEDMIGRELYGKLTKIFWKESKYTIVIVSKNYVDKSSIAIQTEIDAFMKRYQEQHPKTYLIPVKVDDTSLEKVHPDLKDITYIDWDYNPIKLLKTIQEDFVSKQVKKNNPKHINTFKADQINVIQGNGTTHITN